MNTSVDRIVTTHAGSLPRPDDLTQMMFGVLDGTPVDSSPWWAATENEKVRG